MKCGDYLKKFGRAVKKKLSKKKKVGLFVEGGPLLKSRNLEELKLISEPLEELGSIRVSKIFFDRAINEDVIDGIVNAGFSPIMLSGDVDVHITIETLELILEDKADIIAIVASNPNYIPVLNFAREDGKEIVIITDSKSKDKSLENFADILIYYDLLKVNESKKKKWAEKIK